MGRPEELPDGKEVANFLDAVFRKGDLGTLLNLFSPEEFRDAQEEYRKAFLVVMESRGLTRSTIDEIEKAKNAPYLEAECDEEDGGIDLPSNLGDAFFAPYVGIRAPEGESCPVNVRNITLGLNQGRIEIEPKLLNYSDGPKTKGYITIA